MEEKKKKDVKNNIFIIMTIKVECGKLTLDSRMFGHDQINAEKYYKSITPKQKKKRRLSSSGGSNSKDDNNDCYVIESKLLNIHSNNIMIIEHFKSRKIKNIHIDWNYDGFSKENIFIIIKRIKTEKGIIEIMPLKFDRKQKAIGIYKHKDLKASNDKSKCVLDVALWSINMVTQKRLEYDQIYEVPTIIK